MMDRLRKLVSALVLVAVPLSLHAATSVATTQAAKRQQLQDIVNSLRYNRTTEAAPVKCVPECQRR